jgi:hypothetical protein
MPLPNLCLARSLSSRPDRDLGPGLSAWGLENSDSFPLLEKSEDLVPKQGKATGAECRSEIPWLLHNETLLKIERV